MRKLIVMLASSIMLCVGAFSGTHASTPVPDRKVHATELVMFVPTMVATCNVDTVATTSAVMLKPALGPVAPASLVAVDGGNEYLVLLRAMTCPPNLVRKHVSLLGNIEQENDKPHIDPGRKR